jgi:hypothetical protein
MSDEMGFEDAVRWWMAADGLTREQAEERARQHASENGVGPGTAGEGAPAADSETVLAIRRALLEEAQDTRDESASTREEVPGTGGLVYRGVGVVLFGERGQGKSTVQLVIGLGAATAGEKVLYLDRENGVALTRERVEAILDANPDWGDPLADGRFVGRHYPELRSAWRGEDIGEAIGGAGFTVVMYDSTREMLNQFRLDSNKDDDLSDLHSRLVTPLRRRGIAVVLTDNVGHQDTHRPKGSGTKLDAIEQAYKVMTTTRFSAVDVGRVAITCTRSRLGDLDREWSMRVGGPVWELPEAAVDSPAVRKREKLEEGRERFRLTAVAALRENGGPLGREALYAAIRIRGEKGRSTKWHGWLKELAADPASGIAPTPDDGYGLHEGWSQ